MHTRNGKTMTNMDSANLSGKKHCYYCVDYAADNSAGLDCQSHTGLRIGATIFGHMYAGGYQDSFWPDCNWSLPTQEPVHLHLWDSSFLLRINHTLCTHLWKLTSSGSPTALSVMERTATLEAVAETLLSFHVLGGYSRRRPQRT